MTAVIRCASLPLEGCRCTLPAPEWFGVARGTSAAFSTLTARARPDTVMLRPRYESGTVCAALLVKSNEFRHALCTSASPVVGLVAVRKAGLTFSATAQRMSLALRMGEAVSESSLQLSKILRGASSMLWVGRLLWRFRSSAPRHAGRCFNAPDGGLWFGIAELVA